MYLAERQVCTACCAMTREEKVWSITTTPATRNTLHRVQPLSGLRPCNQDKVAEASFVVFIGREAKAISITAVFNDKIKIIKTVLHAWF